MDACIKCIPDQSGSRLWSGMHAFLPESVAICPVVDILRYFLVTVGFFGGGKQVESDRDKTVPIRPAKGKHGESAFKPVIHMVIDPGKQLHLFAPVS